MPEDHTPLIDTPTTDTPSRFPVVAQLGVLGLFMAVLFGSLFLHKQEPSTNTAEIPRAVATIPEERAIAVPATITNVQLTANAAYVWDVRLQRVLYSKNPDAALPLASITKLMTTLLAHELLADDAPTTVPLAAILQEGSSGLAAGEQFTNERLRALALIASSNDAAFALGASVGSLLGDEEPTSQFVQGMNIRAAELGLASMQFWNPTGLDLSETKPGAIGSARDVSFLMEYIVTNYPELITPTQETTARIYDTAGAYHEVNNTNEIADRIPNMIGSKTGYTDLAGGNLTIAFDAGFDRPIIVTVLGSTYKDRFTDVLTLVNAAQQAVSDTQ